MRAELLSLFSQRCFILKEDVLCISIQTVWWGEVTPFLLKPDYLSGKEYKFFWENWMMSPVVRHFIWQTVSHIYSLVPILLKQSSIVSIFYSLIL